MTKTEKAITGIIGGAFAIPLIAVDYIINGWVLSILWGWFMVPIFALPSLSITAAIGGSIVASRFSHYKGIKDFSNKELLIMMSRPWIALLAGYIVKSFM